MNAKKTATFIIVIAMVVMTVFTGAAAAKSLYLIAEHHTGQFDAWKIESDGTATYQATYALSHAGDPAGVAIDESSVTLFITSEFSGAIELVDATKMTSLGSTTAPGASNLAGIEADDDSNIVYTVDRLTDNLYAYDWDSTVKTLTLRESVNLTNCTGAMGIALDDTTGTLWVADSSSGKVRGYNVTTWNEVQNFTPSHCPCDVAVDKQNGFLYTTAPDGNCALSITGSTTLVKINITTGAETNVSLGDYGSMGVAVDCDTGLVYMTGGCNGDTLEVWDTSTSPWTQVQNVDAIGNPAGICIPQKDVEYDKPCCAPVHVGQGPPGATEVPLLTPFGAVLLIGLLAIAGVIGIRRRT
ncbi:MAG: YncE family protein [Euryarchaeota archaeon]|nr:YncE family protein [Euryarchaeota archaeon]